MNRPVLLSVIIMVLIAIPASAGARLSEPRLRLHSAARQQPQLALTLDACSGKTDQRILKALIDNGIPATVFVTSRWLKRNSETVAVMLAHADLFQIENHGARHVPAVDYPARIYGLATAGSPAAVTKEVETGADAVTAATGRAPQWFRGAAARYSQGALAEIAATGETVAGFSIRADDGATLSAAGVEKRLAAARDGDVIIAHMNHPEKAAGDGLVKGLLALKARGYLFVKIGAPPRPVAVHQGS